MSTDSHAQRLDNLLLWTLLPTLLYSALHGFGRYFPVSLWGTDQLHYYPFSVVVLFATVIALSTLLALKPAWMQALDDALEPLLEKPFLTTSRFQMLFGLLFALAVFILRDRQHLLGDGGMWFSTFELFAANPEQGEVPWIDSPFTEPGLQYMPFSEPFSTLIRFQFFRLAHLTFGLDASTSHELLSCLAGFPYALLCLRLATVMTTSALDRVSLLLLLLVPATTQFYCGYVESYTLLHLAATAYVLCGLRYLRGGPFWPVTLFMCLTAAAHLMALAILPSWFYLAWHRLGRPAEARCRNPRIYLPILGLTAVVGLLLYPDFYPYSMGFFTPKEAGMYAVFSADHLALLANVLLLLSPFGLLWTLRFVARSLRQPEQTNATPQHRRDIAFLGWAALGSLGLGSVRK